MKEDLKEISEKNLKLLSLELAQNYFNSSIPSLEDKQGVVNNFFNTKQNLLAYDLMKVKGVPIQYLFDNDNAHSFTPKEVSLSKSTKNITGARNILVIGAGCTFDIFRSIPLASEAIEVIHDYFKFGGKSLAQIINKPIADRLNNNGFKFFVDKYKQEFEKLKLHYPAGYKNDEQTPDFETSLTLLNSFFPASEIREQVRKLYNFRHGAAMTYDIIAHMFKHKLIDVIINFNFDELLDQALDDEIGKNNYHKIISDGDCRPIVELLVEDKLKVPIYIKPHGTASHKSTLRFTKDQYYNLPKDISNLLKEIISCKGQADTTNIITVGFEMGSLEFNQILKENIPKRSKIFAFTYFDNIEDEKSCIKREKQIKRTYKQIFENIDKSPDSPELYLVCQQSFKNSSNNTDLCNAFEVLFNLTSKFYNKLYFPSKIHRHKLVNLLFSNEYIQDSIISNFKETTEVECEKEKSSYFLRYFKSSDYLKDRTLVEILISLLKSNGTINIENALSQRIGEYYSLYDKQFENEKNKRKNPSNSEDESNYFVSETGYTFSQLLETFSEDQTDQVKLYGELKIIISENDLSKPLTSIIEGGFCSEIFKVATSRLLKSDCERILIEEYFIGLLNENSSILMPSFSDPKYHIFKQFSGSDILHTNLAVDYYYLEALSRINIQESSKTTVFIVADNGVKFKKFKSVFSSKVIKVVIILVANDKDDKERLKESLDIKDVDNVNLFFISPYEHTHHMTVFLTPSNLKESKAIYYYQAPYSTKMNPIQIIEKDNIINLLSQFKYYLEKATINKLNTNKESINNFINEIDKYRSDFVTLSGVENES